MPKRTHDREPGCRTAYRRIAAAALGLTLAACTDANGIETSAPRPDVSSPASATHSESRLPTTDAATENLVTERYVEFQQVVAETGATSNADDPRLAEYATGAVLESLRAKLAVRQQSGTRLYGAPVPHVQSVSLSGDRATVKDCLDNSGTGLMDGSGNKLSVGRDRQETTATLVVEEGVWKVSEITTIAGGGSC
jgi:hypothetical protein